MDIATTIIAFLAVIVSSSVTGFCCFCMHQKSLDFMANNMQVGGQPVSIVKAQQQMQHEVQKVEIDRLKELRQQRVASMGD